MQQDDYKTIEYIISELNFGIDVLKEKYPDTELFDEIITRALTLTEINVGESVKRLSDNIKSEFPDIPWKVIAGARDVAAHKYSMMSANRIIDTIRFDFPVLLEQLTDILSKLT